MHYNKEDMALTHYQWENNAAASLPVFTGAPSRRVFDTLNGQQVLFLINYYLNAVDRFSIAEARQLENQIAQKLLLGIRSERSVFNWLLLST